MRIDTSIQTKFKAGALVFSMKKNGERYNVGKVVKIRLDQEKAALQCLVELDNGERRWIDEKRLHEDKEQGGVWYFNFDTGEKECIKYLSELKETIIRNIENTLGDYNNFNKC